MRPGEIHYVLVFMSLASLAMALFGCASAEKAIEQVPEVSPLQIPLDKIVDMPIPSRTVSKSEITSVYQTNYMTTLYDRYQRIDKEQIPCHADNWYTVCVQKDKILVTKNKTKQVAKTVNLTNVDFIGDMKKGSDFFMVVYADGTLHAFFYKIDVDPAKGTTKQKVVKKSYPLAGLEFEGKKVSIAIKDQVAPGFGLWLCAVEKEELTTPLYEIEFIGTGDKKPFIKKLVVQE